MAQEFDEVDTRAVLQRLFDILSTGDVSALDEVMHPDYVQVMPQSGERVVGLDNYRSIIDNYPGGQNRVVVDAQGDFHVAGHGPHYVMTPTFNLVRVEGEGDELTSYVKARYPDGSEWYIINFVTLKDGKILHSTDFFAPLFDAPEWRAQWVERH